MGVFFENLWVFLGLIGLIVLALLVFVYVKTGSWEAFKTHWSTTGDGSAAGMLKATLAVVVLALLAFGVNSVLAEPRWFEYTAIYGGIDVTNDVSPMCEVSDVDDRMTSNIGVRQSIVRMDAVTVLGNYTHHSCAVGVDNDGYDAVGLMIEWRFDRR